MLLKLDILLYFFYSGIQDCFAERFVGWLKYDFPSLTKENKLQTHRCGNAHCLCHICPESNKLNTSRIKCHKSGCAMDCDHEPKCLFQVNGKILQCRSDPTTKECGCGQDSFEGRMFSLLLLVEFDYQIFQ